MTDRLKADLAVLGSGVTGLTIAFEAAQAGLEVIVLSQPRPNAASPAAGGMLTPSAEADGVPQSLIDFASESCQLYPSFVERLEKTSQLKTGYNPHGTLLVAVNRDQLSELQHLEQFQRSLGIEVNRPTVRQIRELEENLSPRLAGGLYAPGENSINPLKLSAALSEALRRAGSKHLNQTASVRLLQEGERVTGIMATSLDDHQVHIQADSVVAADGAWTHQLQELKGRLPLRPIKGQFVRVRGAPLITRTVRTPDVYLVPRDNGEIYIGATSEEVGFDATLRAGATMDLLWQAWRALPGIYELSIEDMGVGFRPALRDNLPLIDQGPLEGLIVATGHYRHGIMLAPITGQRVLEMVQTKGIPETLRPFGWDRFNQHNGN